MRFKNPEGQLARWLEWLQEYNFRIEHRRGSVHNNADALSRRPCEEDCRHCNRKEERETLLQVRLIVLVDNQDVICLHNS